MYENYVISDSYSDRRMRENGITFECPAVVTKANALNWVNENVSYNQKSMYFNPIYM